MTEMLNKLSDLFSGSEFMAKIEDYSDFESVYAEVKKREPAVTEEHLKKFLELVSLSMTTDELDESALEDVAGGGFIEVCGGIYAVSKLVSFSYNAGKAFGEFIRNWRR